MVENGPDLRSQGRISWGEPVTLDGQEADRIRNFLVCQDRTSAAYFAGLENALNVFVPVVEACEETRRAIGEVASYIDNIDVRPSVDDPDYDSRQVELSRVLTKASDAFEVKPEGCEMQCNGRGMYNCDRCDFQVTV